MHVQLFLGHLWRGHIISQVEVNGALFGRVPVVCLVLVTGQFIPILYRDVDVPMCFGIMRLTLELWAKNRCLLSHPVTPAQLGLRCRRTLSRYVC